MLALLLNVMEMFSVRWIDRVWFSKEGPCCTCDLSVHLSVPSISFVYFEYVRSNLLI